MVELWSRQPKTFERLIKSSKDLWQSSLIHSHNSSAIWKNKHFLPPDTYTYMCVLGGKKYLFFVKFGVLCFLVTFVLRFALLLYCGQIYKNLNGLGLPKRTPKWWKGYPESFILCCLVHWTNFWLNSWVYKVWRLHLSGSVEQSVSVQINDVVLETFLSSANSLHRCLRIKHQTFQTSHFILFTH